MRELSEEDVLALLDPRMVDSTRPATTALVPFSEPRIRAVLHEAKYHGNRKALNLLGAIVAAYLREADMDIAKIRMVPVPLHTERYRERGYNQAEEIAKRAARVVDAALDTGLLVRARETLSQVALERRERELNLLGAFAATGPADAGLLYIVFDDVITTGATLQAAIDALREAGAEHIFPVALAH